MLAVCYPTGYLLLAVLLVLLFAKTSTVFYAFVLSSPLTTVAVFKVGDDSIVLYQLVFVILILKTLILHMKNRSGERPLSNTISSAFWTFWIFCACSIPLALFYGDVVVVTPDSVLSNAKFSIQQFTQFGYLAIAFLSCYACNRLLQDGVISPKKVFVVLTVSYVLVCVLALLQLVLPVELVTELYRNSTHVMYAHQGARISSTFNEPSMLSLFIAPLFCVYVYRFMTGLSWSALLLAGLGLTVAVFNNSSSFVVGMLFGFLACLFLMAVSLKKTARFSRKAIIGFALVSLAALFVVGSNEFGQIFSTFVGKIGGEGVSGNDRLFSFFHHFQVFLEHPFVGIGFGTVRSTDLLTTWLAELGVVGFAFYMVPLVLLVGRLAARFETLAIETAIYIVAYVGILFVSVPEPYYVFGWIVIGLGFHLVRSRESVSVGKRQKEPFEAETDISLQGSKVSPIGNRIRSKAKIGYCER